MTVAPLDTARAHRVAPGAVLNLEPFSSFAHLELAAVQCTAVDADGMLSCVQPDCARQFKPRLQNQTYCCAACKRADTAEFRAVGLKAARPLLVWRTYRYAKAGTPEKALCGRAMAYLNRLQSGWLNSRKGRTAAALKRQWSRGRVARGPAKPTQKGVLS
ncbi:hypothetical protein [Yoonia sp. 208BN28-4]|uniref:hypothetical protein n=1 Tax=Yoonia sp. 208BN28-4 TaxID=3126505 RepID=UPI00309E22B3